MRMSISGYGLEDRMLLRSVFVPADVLVENRHFKGVLCIRQTASIKALFLEIDRCQEKKQFDFWNLNSEQLRLEKFYPGWIQK